MAYIWKYGSGIISWKDLNNYHNKPCFAALHLPNKPHTHITVFGSINNDFKDGFVGSKRFTRFVNYWLYIGNKLGFKFKHIKWDISEDKQWIRFIFPVIWLQRYKKPINKSKLLHLHFFYLRLINEPGIIPWTFMRYRNQLKKEGFNLIQSLYIVENLVITYRYDIKNKFVNIKTPANGDYKTCGHSFFSGLSVKQAKNMKKFPNIRKAFEDAPNLKMLDLNLFGGRNPDDKFFSNIVDIDFKKLKERINNA